MRQKNISQATNRQVRRAGDQSKNQIPIRLKNATTMTAYLTRRNAPGRPMALQPLHNRRYRNIKPSGHRPTGLARPNR